MKIFFSEHQNIYSSYTFSYGVYCLKENQNELPAIYEKGFLPYSADFSINKELFYLARSVRIDLRKFADTSENRRVNRLVHPLGIEIIPAEKKAFNVNYPDFISFCTYYAADRFVGGSMSEERLQYLLHRETLSHIFTFRSQDKLYGYVFAVLAQNMLHYWFSFFDVTYLQSHSMGKWMMWRMIHWAQEKGLDFVYLGTCYKAKALYKIRDHKGVEFFDGVGWNENMNMLKFLCQTDEAETPKNCDLLKRSDKTADMVFKNLHD